jgi:hypothetical protein
VAAPEPGLRVVAGRLLAVGLLVVTAACGGSTGHASTPSASPSTSPSALVTVLPAATPTGGADLPVTQVGFTCSLPAVLTSGGGDSASYQGGFISFPAGTFAQGPGGMRLYDTAVRRWLPVGATQTSPDGASYAYVTGGTSSGQAATFHIVDVSTASQRTFAVSVPNVASADGIQVMDYDGSGVYFVVAQAGAYPVGVWRLDARTGKVAALARVANVMAVSGGFAWVGELDPHDPSPPKASSSRPLFNTIAQVNLSSGAQTTWFYSPGRSETLLGLAAGRPVLDIGDGPDFPVLGGEVRLLDHPSSGAEDSGQLVYGGGVGLSDPLGDGDRVWLGSDRGVYLFTADGGLQKVFAAPASEVGTITSIAPAGPCL